MRSLSIKTSNTPHQSELDLKLEQVINEAEDIKMLILTGLTRKSLNQSVIQDALYRASSICLVLENILKKV